MTRILVADGLSSAGLRVLQEEETWQVDVHSRMTPEELRSALRGVDALCVRSASKVTADVLAAADRLKVIGRAGSGVDNIDLQEATRRGVVVLNTPDANTISVADHTLALLLALCRNLPFAHADLKQGRWEKKKYQGAELAGKTVGVLGLGRIGREVVKRLGAFDVRVIAHDPYVSRQAASEMNVELLTLEEVLSSADFLTLHMPLTPRTAQFINGGRLRQMKRGVNIINCARGELIDETALLEALNEGIVGGAALDVFSQEPPRGETLQLLVQHPRVVVTPHLAASTAEAQEKVGRQIAVQLRDYLKEGMVRNAVNFYSMSREEYLRTEPFLLLGERLGAFAAQVCDGGCDRVKIEFRGSVADLSREAILHAVLKGVLTPALSDQVNLVNAAAVAGERSIRVESVVSPPDASFSSLLAVAVATDQEEHRVTGTVFEKEMVRLITVDGVYLDFQPKGILLFFRNKDTPGVVGRIGTLLGTHSINIGAMKLGRIPEMGQACGVVAVDGEVAQEILSELRAIPDIHDIRLLRI
jgi:D-3-phosphoglycerate dehydrogenase